MIMFFIFQIKFHKVKWVLCAIVERTIYLICTYYVKFISILLKSMSMIELILV